MKTGKYAFTLIELLIVVAIIAILAAIAVPNFLEAQTRSKVSRARADMRSVVTAIESYRVDTNLYPWRNTAAEPNNAASWKFPYGGSYFITLEEAPGLTTPIAYLTSNQLKDPFLTSDVEAQNLWYVNQLNASNRVASTKAFAYDRHTRNQAYPSFVTNLFQKAVDPGYGLLSTGPDRLYYDEAWGAQSWGIGAAHYTVYDPTNGTVSRGNIWRFGP